MAQSWARKVQTVQKVDISIIYIKESVHMRKLLYMILTVVFLTGCSSNVKNDNQEIKETSYNYLDSIDKDQIAYASVDADMAYNIADPLQLRENATNVFLATVSSIDSATCNLAGYEFSPIPYTLGKLEVLKNYVGDVEGTVQFSRSGGTVTLDEYNRNAPKSSVSKREHLQKGKSIRYMSVKLADDIDLEVNKTYLIYATYNEEYNRYEIIGFEYGSREVTGYNEKTKTFRNSTTILNNHTNETESFEEYVNSYLG